MVDRIGKALKKMAQKQRDTVLEIVDRIIAGDLTGLDVKKLRGTVGKYRVRIGSYRIIFSKTSRMEAEIISIDHRSESTYRDV